jgi:trk system potassium uptake protein TrkH
MCFFGGFAISCIEKLPMVTCLFEAASAIGTVGLTLGITPELGNVSRLILISLMFIGRVGGLTLVFSALGRKNTVISKLPQERITVG